MFAFGHDNRIYQKLKNALIQKAEIRGQQLSSTCEDYMVELFRKAKVDTTGDAMTTDKRRIADRTPIELKPLLELLLENPPELSAYLVLCRIEKAIAALHLPIQLQGDIMMAFENANYFMPEKTVQAARHIAYALCMMPKLETARSNLLGLGVPYTKKPVSQEEVEFMVKQGYLPYSFMGFTGYTVLGWNLEMRTTVAQELEEACEREHLISRAEVSRLFRLDQMRSMEPKGIRRWEHQPNPEAEDLLDRGIAEPDSHKAYGLFEQAGKLEPLLLPDVWRNQSWILAKWGRYDEAITLCEQALKAEPEYAEVWYHMGICLAKSRRFTQALHAFEKAKSLGFRKEGLEPNICTCKRAIANGLG